MKTAKKQEKSSISKEESSMIRIYSNDSLSSIESELSSGPQVLMFSPNDCYKIIRVASLENLSDEPTPSLRQVVELEVYPEPNAMKYCPFQKSYILR